MNIDESTNIKLFAAIAALPAIATCVFWIAAIQLKAEAAERVNEKQDAKLETQMTLLLDIRDRIIRIESTQKHKKGE